MMMKKVLVLFLLCYSSVGFSQFTRDHRKGDTIYYDSRYKVTSKELAKQYSIIKEINKQVKPRIYLLERYKLDTTSQEFIKYEIFYSNYVRWISREGKNTIFWKNGQKQEEGNRKKGKPIGIWQNWYKDGTKMAEYEYFDENDVSKPKGRSYRLVNFWNREGEQIVKDGTGNYFLKKDNGEEILGSYVNYEKEGIWKGFRKDGTKMYEDSYKEGVFQQGESWDEVGNRYTYEKISERGEYSEGRRGLIRMISENFKVPKYATEMAIEGITKIGFIVNKEGKVEGIEVVQPLCEPCDQEAIRVVKLLKDWTPGKLRGQKANMKYTLPFRIKLTAK